MTLQSYRIASGYSQTLSSSDNIENITPTGGAATWQIPVTGGKSYYFVDGIGRWQQNYFVTASGLYVTQGFARQVWIQSAMDSEAYTYLKDTFVGKVTIQSRTEDTSAYAEYNAIFQLSEPNELEKIARGSRTFYRDVEWRFTRMVAL